MNTPGVSGGGGQHYRPNLRPADPGKSYQGRHKVEVLSKNGDGTAPIGFANLRATSNQTKEMMRHTFSKQDAAFRPEVGNLAQRFIQPRSSN